MPVFLTNVMAVLLLQPARFVELHPRTLRISALASIMGWSWLSLFLEPHRVIVYFVVGLLALWTGPAACSRVYGSKWRAAFAMAWCALLATVLSSIAQSWAADVVFGSYLFVGVKLQMHRPEPGDLTEVERCELRVARAAMAAGGDGAAFALTCQGAVYLREIGPATAKWLGYEIPEYLVDVLGRRWVFEGTTCQGSMAPLQAGELLLPPGALYRPA